MSLKISYFNARGLAEPTRWILSHAGVDFEDIRAPLESIPSSLPPEIKESKLKCLLLIKYDRCVYENQIFTLCFRQSADGDKFHWQSLTGKLYANRWPSLVILRGSMTLFQSIFTRLHFVMNTLILFGNS